MNQINKIESNNISNIRAGQETMKNDNKADLKMTSVAFKIT